MKIIITITSRQRPQPYPVTTLTLECNEGLFEHEPGKIPSFGDILEWLFRQFNRVDETEAISLFRIPIPSLSMGDLVKIEYVVDGELRNKKWRCAPVGWVQESSDPFVQQAIPIEM